MTHVPPKPKTPIPISLGLAVLLLPAAAVGLLHGDEAGARSRLLDGLLRPVCQRDPAPEAVRVLVGTVVGRHEFGSGCRWGGASTGLVARPNSTPLEEWTRTRGPTDGTTFSASGIRVELVHSSADCTAAFGNASGTVEVMSTNEGAPPTEDTPACVKTLAAAAAIADAIRGGPVPH